jgi:hypothetical protein
MEEFCVNNQLMSKKMISMLLTFDFALHFPLGGLLLCLRVITQNPALVTSDKPGLKGCIAGAPRRRWHAAASDQLSEIALGQIQDSLQHVHQAPENFVN